MWSVGGGSGCVCVGVAVKGQDGNSDVIFVPIDVLLYDSHMCAALFILQRASVSNILNILF